MKLTLSEIAAGVRGVLTGPDRGIESVSIDTRTLTSGQLYVALRGKNFDGNLFIAQAEAAGAAAALVADGVKASIPTVAVADTRLALADMAGVWRRRWQMRARGRPAAVIGVTGSNGKTTVKEMVAAVLATDGAVLHTQGNLNNDIGVPLTLLRLNENHRYGVIEMGANHLGEIAYVSRYVEADAVIITNAGAAHIEGFGSLDGVARAKGEIVETLRPGGTAILNRDDAYFEYWRRVAGGRRVVSFGLHPDADILAVNIATRLRKKDGLSESGGAVAFETAFDVTTPAGSEVMTLALAGAHNVVNALAAVAAGMASGLSLAQIRTGLAAMKPVTGRLQPLLGRLGSIVIDDTYNANASSLKAGLEVLRSCGGESWAVLGAFGELGPESPDLHADMGALIKASGVKRLWATGQDAARTVRAFGEGAAFFDSQADLIRSLTGQVKGVETILIKGSRMQRMENVAAALVENFRN